MLRYGQSLTALLGHLSPPPTITAFSRRQITSSLTRVASFWHLKSHKSPIKAESKVVKSAIWEEGEKSADWEKWRQYAKESAAADPIELVPNVPKKVETQSQSGKYGLWPECAFPFRVPKYRLVQKKGTVLLSTSLAWPVVAGCSCAETFSQLSSISFAQPCT